MREVAFGYLLQNSYFIISIDVDCTSQQVYLYTKLKCSTKCLIFQISNITCTLTLRRKQIRRV